MVYSRLRVALVRAQVACLALFSAFMLSLDLELFTLELKQIGSDTSLNPVSWFLANSFVVDASNFYFLSPHCNGRHLVSMTDPPNAHFCMWRAIKKTGKLNAD